MARVATGRSSSRRSRSLGGTEHALLGIEQFGVGGVDLAEILEELAARLAQRKCQGDQPIRPVDLLEEPLRSHGQVGGFVGGGFESEDRFVQRSSGYRGRRGCRHPGWPLVRRSGRPSRGPAGTHPPVTLFRPGSWWPRHRGRCAPGARRRAECTDRPFRTRRFRGAPKPRDRDGGPATVRGDTQPNLVAGPAVGRLIRVRLITTDGIRIGLLLRPAHQVNQKVANPGQIASVHLDVDRPGLVDVNQLAARCNGPRAEDRDSEPITIVDQVDFRVEFGQALLDRVQADSAADETGHRNAVSKQPNDQLLIVTILLEEMLRGEEHPPWSS